MAHALACADARRGWVHPSRIDDRNGHTSLPIVAIAGALIVSLKMTGATEQRLHESQRAHHVLVRRQRCAERIDRPSGGGRPIVRGRSYARDVHVCIGRTPDRRLQVRTASNGETQITRTFNGVTPIVVAHFAGTARPNVTVAYDSSTPPVPMSVTMRFTKPSDCSLVCRHAVRLASQLQPCLGDHRRQPAPRRRRPVVDRRCEPAVGAGQLPRPGHDDRLHRRLDEDCSPDLRRADHGVGLGTPRQPLSDADTTTAVTSAAGSKAEARVLLGSVDPPDPGVTPTLEFHASAASNGAIKVAASIYDGNTLLVQNANIGNVNQPGSFDWTLSATTPPRSRRPRTRT